MQDKQPQSTAFTWVFKLYLTDHVTPATGKTVAITISKNTGAFGNPSVGASNATEIANGWYYFTTSTTDTGTLGPLIMLGTCAGCDNADQVYGVVKATNSGWTAIPDTPATTNASLLTSGTSTDQLSVASGKVILQATQTGVTIPTVTTLTNLPSIPANWLTATGINAGALNGKGDWLLAANVPSNFAALGISITGKISEVVLCDTLTTYTGNTPQTGDAYARIGATGSGLSSLAPAATALSTAQWTNTLATNLGTLASHDPGTTIGTSTYAGGAVASVTAAVTVTMAQALASPRDISAVADGSLQLNDALWAAIGAGAGQHDASSGTSMTVKTPSTATLLRTFTITTATAPTTVPTKIV